MQRILVVAMSGAGKTTAARLLRRSLVRSWRRDRIFGGNVERWRDWISRDHPFWHAVTTFDSRRAYLAKRAAREAHLQTVRLRMPAEFEIWLQQVELTRQRG